MRFYRVAYRTIAEASTGFEWFTSHHEAQCAAHGFERESTDNTAEVQSVDVEPTRKGILHVLDVFAVHPDNG